MYTHIIIDAGALQFLIYFSFSVLLKNWSIYLWSEVATSTINRRDLFRKLRGTECWQGNQCCQYCGNSDIQQWNNHKHQLWKLEKTFLSCIITSSCAFKTRAANDPSVFTEKAPTRVPISTLLSHLRRHTMPGGTSTSSAMPVKRTTTSHSNSHSRVQNCWSLKSLMGKFCRIANIWGEICKPIKSKF